MALTRKLRRIVGILLLSFPFALPSAWSGPNLPVAKQVEICLQGRDLLLQRRYGEAEKFLIAVTMDYPDKLLGYFGLMALNQVRNLDNFDFRFDEAYRSWEEKGRPLAIKIAKSPEAAEPWDLLLAGGTLGISGFYRAHNTKWLAALRDASLGFHTIERAARRDPSLKEALLGVGLYDYWRSYFTRKVVFLPFFSDRRKEGREELEQAARESRFASVLAEIAIAFIDFQEKRYQNVLGICDRLLVRYPQNTILRMLKGDTLIRLKRYREALPIFESILKTDPALTKSYFFMGIALAREGKEKEAAKAYLEKFLEQEPSATKEWRKRAMEALKALEKKK